MPCDDQNKIDNIAYEERINDEEYYDSLQQNNTYYITIPFKNENGDKYSDGYLKDLHISNRGFFNNSAITVKDYIREYSINEIPENANLEIVKTAYHYYPDGTYLANVVIKTIWLKIVQRRWRRNHRLRGCLYDMKKTNQYICG